MILTKLIHYIVHLCVEMSLMNIKSPEINKRPNRHTSSTSPSGHIIMSHQKSIKSQQVENKSKVSQTQLHTLLIFFF